MRGQLYHNLCTTSDGTDSTDSTDMDENNRTCDYPHGGLYPEAVRYGLGGTGIALALCSVICNSIIITAFARVKDLRKAYNVLIINVVLGDLFYCFASGFEIVPLFCIELLCNAVFNRVRTWFRLMFMFLSFFSISAVACERFIAIQFPFQYVSHVSYSRCVAVASGIWIFSGLMPAIRGVIRHLEQPVAAILLVVVVVLYTRIYIVSRRHTARDLQSGVRVKHSKATAAVLTAVVTGLSWSPVICTAIMHVAFGIRAQLKEITNLSLLLGTCFNLLIYTYRMEDFRKGVKHILRLDRNIVQARNTDLAITK